MAWDLSYISDGSLAVASLLTSRFDNAKTYIDDLDLESMQRGCFRSDHFGDNGLLYNDWSGGTMEHESGDHTYTLATFGVGVTYTTFGADTATRLPSTYVGDRTVIGHADASGPYSGGLSELLNSGGTGPLGNANGIIAGVWAMFNCNLKDAVDCDAVFFCLQAEMSNSSWYTIERTERLFYIDGGFLASRASEHLNRDISIATLILPADITDFGGDVATDDITGLRACVSMLNPVNDASVTLNRYNLSAISLQAKDPA